MSSLDDRFYSEAAYLVCLVLGGSCRIKTALYESNFTTDLRKLFALGCNTLNNYSLLHTTMCASGLSTYSSRAGHLTKSDDDSDACFECSLAVLVHDLVLGSKRGAKHRVLMRRLALITGDSHAFKKIRQAYHATRKEVSGLGIPKLVDSQSPDTATTVIKLPYYTRVNNLLTNMTEVIEKLQNNGFTQRSHNPSTDSYHRFLKRVRKLKANQFMVDHHLPDKLLVFPVGTALHQLDLYKSHHLILQDKASCIPPEVLKPIYTADALDACAAPGNKTLQLVGALSPDSTLFAVDRDPTRFRRLCTHLATSGVQRLIVEEPFAPELPPSDSADPAQSSSLSQPRVQALCADFLALDPNDHRFARVQSILLDPSCTGSGLTVRQPDGTHRLGPTVSSFSARISPQDGSMADEVRSEQPDQRLRRLANLQAQLLRHAFQFPSVQRVVYSTCSINPEENEHVVSELLERFAGQFALEPIWQDTPETKSETAHGVPSPTWTNRGLAQSGCAACIRATPHEDLTNGFFVACFRRLNTDPAAIEDQARHARKRSRHDGNTSLQKAEPKRSHTVAQQPASDAENLSNTKQNKTKKRKHKKHRKTIGACDASP